MIEPEKSKVFFDLVINHGQLYSNDGQIEFRPNGTQGLKLPLGINFKNKPKKPYIIINNNNNPLEFTRFNLI
jgi:hypothetical protein